MSSAQSSPPRARFLLIAAARGTAAAATAAAAPGISDGPQDKLEASDQIPLPCVIAADAADASDEVKYAEEEKTLLLEYDCDHALFL